MNFGVREYHQNLTLPCNKRIEISSLFDEDHLKRTQDQRQHGYDKISDVLLRDFAGNAFSLPVVMVAILAVMADLDQVDK